jgi:hypothetical protein
MLLMYFICAPSVLSIILIFVLRGYKSEVTISLNAFDNTCEHFDEQILKLTGNPNITLYPFFAFFYRTIVKNKY